jgi:hypothetical protein
MPDEPEVIAPEEEEGEDEASVKVSTPKTFWQKVFATIGFLTPQKIQKIAGVWGAPVFLGFVLGLIPGFLGAVALYKGGWAPSNWVAKDYKEADQSQPSPQSHEQKPRVKETKISYSIVEKPDEPMQSFEQLLNKQGEAQKGSKLIKEMAIGTIVSQRLDRAEAFSWLLNVTQPDFKMWGIAVRQSKQGVTLVYEPVKSTQNPSQSLLNFQIPQCEDGDVIYVALIVTSPREGSIDFATAFK